MSRAPAGASRLRAPTRRETQLPQVTLMPPPLAHLPGDRAEGGPAGYGFGLFVEEHPVLVRIHQPQRRGYRGSAANTRWHPGTGSA